MTAPPATPVHRADRYLEQLPPLLITHVSPTGVDALTTDTRGTWRVTHRPTEGWACTCPAKSTACGHIAAVRQVAVLDDAGSAT